MKASCHWCGKSLDLSDLKTRARFYKARNAGLNLYCDRACAGMARRNHNPPTEVQRKEAKRLYDAQRRSERLEELRKQKRDYYVANRERILAQMVAYRKEHMPRHVEYCRRPEYREWKKGYDHKHESSKYGEFGDEFRLLQELEKEIRSRATAYELLVAKGYYMRSSQQRRRELWQQIKSSRKT